MDTVNRDSLAHDQVQRIRCRRLLTPLARYDLAASEREGVEHEARQYREHDLGGRGLMRVGAAAGFSQRGPFCACEWVHSKPMRPDLAYFDFESGSVQNLFSRPVMVPPQGDFRVAEYRAFPVGIDGHFIGFEPLICDSDDEAITKAKRLVDGHDIELWCGERLVIRIEHTSK